jgi:hypothetical protein
MVGRARSVYRRLIPKRDVLYEELNNLFHGIEKQRSQQLNQQPILLALSEQLRKNYLKRQMSLVVFPPSKDVLHNCREWDELVERFYLLREKFGEDKAKRDYWESLWAIEEEWRDEHPKIQLQHADKNTFIFYW